MTKNYTFFMHALKSTFLQTISSKHGVIMEELLQRGYQTQIKKWLLRAAYLFSAGFY